MRLIATVLTIAAMAGPAAARDPLTDLVDSFFNYREPPPPRSGNCNEIASEVGPGAVWYGEFSGKRYQINDRFRMYSARGCFASEADCRIWQEQALTYASGAISQASCRPGYAGG